MASTHTIWLVIYLAVEAEGGLYPHHVSGLLPGSQGLGWPIPTLSLVCNLAVEAEGDLYQQHVADKLPGSQG